MKNTLIISILFACWLPVLAQIHGLGPKMVFPAEVVAGKRLEAREVDGPPQIFPAMVPLDSLEKVLPSGLYIVRWMDHNQLEQAFLQVSPLQQVQLVGELPRLRLRLSLEGLKPSQARVFVGNQRMAFDSASQTFALPNFKNKLKERIRIEYPGGTHWLQINHYQHDAKEWVISPERMLVHARPHSKHRYYGYLVFSQPKYKVGDTLRYKLFVVNRRGKPLSDSMEVRLTQGYNGLRREEKLTATHPGAYTYELVLDESLGLQLDRNLEANVYYRDKYIHISGTTYIEAYKLKEVTWKVEMPTENLWQPDSTFQISVSALDPNGRPAPDATMKASIWLTDLQGIDPQARTRYVADTLYSYRGKVQNIVLQPSQHPGARAGYTVKIELQNAANETKIETRTFSTTWQQKVANRKIINDFNDDLARNYLADSAVLEPAPGMLKVVYEMPLDTTPGAEVDVLVRVTDHTGAPVAGADILSLAINAQMDAGGNFVSRVPDFVQPVRAKTIRESEIVGPQNIRYNAPKTPTTTPALLAKMEVEDSVFYRLMWPQTAEYLKFALPQKGKMQIAPFIYRNGIQEAILMVWTSASNNYTYNRQLVWHTWANMPYSIPVDISTPDFTVQVRTAKAIYTIQAVPHCLDTKYFISINPDSLPANVTMKKMPNSLTNTELSEINSSTLVLTKSGPQTAVYAWQDQTFTDIKSIAGKTILFPVRYNQKITIGKPNQWQRSFQIYTGYMYDIKEDVIREIPSDFVTKKTSLKGHYQDFDDYYTPSPTWDEIVRADKQNFPKTSRGWVFSPNSNMGGYAANQNIIGFYRMSDSSNIWLVSSQQNKPYDIYLPEGKYKMLMVNDQNMFSIRETEIKKGFVCFDYIADSTFRSNAALAERLVWGQGYANGRWVNDLVRWGPMEVRQQVVDITTGKPLCGATVLLVHPVGQLAGTETDSLGKFSFSNFNLDSCRVLVLKDGYEAGFYPARFGDTIRLQPAKPSPDTYFQQYPCRFMFGSENLLFYQKPNICVSRENTNCIFALAVNNYSQIRPVYALSPLYQHIPAQIGDYPRLVGNAGGIPGDWAIVAGTVWDPSGQPLVGAVVVVEGLTLGAMVSEDGYFSMKIPSGHQHLIVTYLGMKQQRIDAYIAAGGKYEINIFMEEEYIQVDEVVVVAEDWIVRNLSGRVAGVAVGTRNVIRKKQDESVSVRGARESNTVYYVDGVKVRGNSDSSRVDHWENANGFLDDTESEEMSEDRWLESDVLALNSAALQIQLRTHFADCAWWQPLLTTDAQGVARFRTRLPDDITAWNAYAIAMTGNRQSGLGRAQIRAHKPVEARLAVPDFLLAGDTVQAIGRVLSETPDPQKVELNFGEVGKPLQSLSATVSGSLKQTFSLTASPDDSLIRAQFTAALPSGGDGEERKIPVYPVGVREAIGELLILENDTSFTFSPKAGAIADSAWVSVSSDNLFPLLRQIEDLKNYPYLCNEQASSKLAAYLAARAIDSVLHRPNTDSATIAKLVKKLCDGQNESGLWGWFPGMSDHVWLSSLILKRIYAADSAAKCIPKAQLALATALRTDTSLTPGVRLALLRSLAATHFAMDYSSQIDSLHFASDNQSALANLGALKADLGLSFDQELKTLMPFAHKTLTGGLFWGQYDWSWYGNGWETSLLIYRMLRQSGDSTGAIRGKIRRGLLEQAQAYTINTLQVADLLATLLPDLLQKQHALVPPSITVSGGGQTKTTTDFPQHYRVKAGEMLKISKIGSSPVYFSYDQEFWNAAPKPFDSLFTIITHLEQDGKITSTLHTGKPAELVVTVQSHYAGTYLALDVPIPAGCTYAAKPQFYTLTDCHREYDYHQTTIFMERMWTGTHTYRIPLEVRFDGNFTLNPARIHAMYMPHKQGFNGVKRVEVK